MYVRVYVHTGMNDCRGGFDSKPLLGESLVIWLTDEGDVNRMRASIGHHQTPRLGNLELDISEMELHNIEKWRERGGERGRGGTKCRITTRCNFQVGPERSPW